MASRRRISRTQANQGRRWHQQASVGQIATKNQRPATAGRGQPAPTLCLSTLPPPNPYSRMCNFGASTTPREKEWTATSLHMETWTHRFPSQHARCLRTGHQTRLLGGSEPQAHTTHGHYAWCTIGRPLSVAWCIPHNLQVATTHQDGKNARRTLSDRTSETLSTRTMSRPFQPLSESCHSCSSRGCQGRRPGRDLCDPRTGLSR